MHQLTIKLLVFEILNLSVNGTPTSLSIPHTESEPSQIMVFYTCKRSTQAKAIYTAGNQGNPVLITFCLHCLSSKKSTHKIELMLIIYGTVNSYSLSASLNKHLNKGPRLLCLECHVTGHHPHPQTKSFKTKSLVCLNNLTYRQRLI